jgi:3-methyladenine DNA glycosylase AlkD
VIATLPLIKLGQFDEILDLAHHFLSHEHDLMHKAVGWMLRELGKVNPNGLRGFLKRHASQMPRTMLRYAIERLDRAELDRWLNA